MVKDNFVNHEDLIMKKAMEVFCSEGLKFFGIYEKVIEAGHTEIVVLETKNLHMDYTFLMESDRYFHFEFQTTNKGKKDLRRFRAYESLLGLQTNKDVITYVIYSGEIKDPSSKLKTGINEYNIKTISMYNVNGDIVLDRIEKKIKKKEEVSKSELVSLTFTPIMGGSLSKADRIMRSIRIIEEVEDDYKYDIESMLYAFADKFLKGKELEEIKEEIAMTKLGKMLREEGIREGIKEGIKQKGYKDAENLLRLGVDEKIVAEGIGLSLDKVREIKKKILN